MLATNRAKIKRIGQTIILNTIKRKIKEVIADLDDIKTRLTQGKELFHDNLEDQMI